MPAPGSSRPRSSASIAPAHDLWWLIPEVLAGTSMPFVHPKRHAQPHRGLEAYPDELAPLWHAGIRAIVSLLHMPHGMLTHTAAGFKALNLPIQDGCPPTYQQFQRFVAFVDLQRSEQKPVAVHCVAGIGRTGVMLAGYLVAKGASARQALDAVRAVRPGAVETRVQWEFLKALESDR